MIYLDSGATSFPKLPQVKRAVLAAMERCANPGRGGHAAAMAADRVVYGCRERAANLFHCLPEQVVFTSNCTHGLNIAINTLVKPGSRVVISGFEHNAVTRPLHGLGAQVRVAGRRLFDWQDTLEEFEKALAEGMDAAVFTHVSNVFGYVLPVAQLSRLCRRYGVPFVIDAAQAAGCQPIDLVALGADFIAAPGHKGLLGPQGTGLLLCNREPVPLIRGGTGNQSILQDMPRELPERLEAGTVNVPGIAGLRAGLDFLLKTGVDKIRNTEETVCKLCVKGLERAGFPVFSGDHQCGCVSFRTPGDCQETADMLARYGVAVRAGLHCAPLAHESAGTLETGTVRVSFSHDSTPEKLRKFLEILPKVVTKS